MADDDFTTGLLAQRKEERERRDVEAAEDPEIAAMKTERNRLQDESLDASSRALRLARETEQTGAQTTEKLKRQGEQLKRTEELSNEANASADASHKSSKDLKKYNGWFAFRFPRFKKKSKKKDDEEYEKRKDEIEKDKMRIKAKRAGKGDLGDDIKDDFNDENDAEYSDQVANLSKRDKDKQYEENLDGIHSAVKNLKQMSLEMNDELEEQDTTLRSIDNTTAHTSETLEKTNKNIQKFV